MKQVVCMVSFALLLAGDVRAQSIQGRPFKALTTDSVQIFGDVYSAAADNSAPVILLFHQGGGDSRGEYGPLVGRLTAEGYHCIAIDQRRGGDRFQGVNRTLAGVAGRSFTYCDVYPDLVAAMAYARAQGFTGKMVAWGSSYSAALVFRLALEYPQEISAILAFSPAGGEPMAGCDPMPYARQLTVPALVLRPVRELQYDHVVAQLRSFESLGYETYVAEPGVHGSSMLNADRVGASTEETWKEVLTFLDRVTRMPRNEQSRRMKAAFASRAWTIGSWMGYREDGTDGSRAAMTMAVSAILDSSGFTHDLHITDVPGTYDGHATEVFDAVGNTWVREYVNATNGRFVRIHGKVRDKDELWRSMEPSRTRESHLTSARLEDGTWVRTLRISDDGGTTWHVLWRDVLQRDGS